MVKIMEDMDLTSVRKLGNPRDSVRNWAPNDRFLLVELDGVLDQHFTGGCPSYRDSIVVVCSILGV